MNSGLISSLRIYSHNVHRNYLLMDTVLETNKDSFDILFIQEPPWRTICQAPSTCDPNGEPVVGGPIHPEWSGRQTVSERTSDCISDVKW